VLLCLLIPLTRAADLAELQVSESEGVYRIRLVMQLQAPAQQVQYVLTDYTRIYRLNPSIIESEILPAPDHGVVRVRTRLLDCIAFFCKQIERVEDVRESGSGRLLATTVPALSSFKSGDAEWQIHRMGERTQVTYQAQMEPDFYIPPVIGSYFVKKKLLQGMLTSLERIECIARIHAGLERNLAPDEPRMAIEAAGPDGADPTLALVAPAAGNSIGVSGDCARSCATNDASCQR
jgi:hypothetical protein